MSDYFLTGPDHDALKAMLRWWKNQGSRQPLHRVQPPLERVEPPLLMYCAAEVPAWGCVREVSFSRGEKRRRIATVEKPSTTFSRNYLLNGPHIIGGASAAGGVGSAQLDAYQVALYDSGTPAVGETWGPKPGQFTLSKNYPGFRVLGIIDSTAKLALVVPEPILTLHGKADSAISKGSSGTVSIWVGAGGSEADSTINVTAYARGVAITSGKIVTVQFINGVPYVGCWES